MKCIDLPTVLNTLRTVIVRIILAERSLSAISGKTIVAAHRPKNGRAEKKPFWNHQIEQNKMKIIKKQSIQFRMFAAHSSFAVKKINVN